MQRVVDALFDPSQIHWSFERPAPGEEPGLREFFVGVGTREATQPPHPRMLLWKLPQWRTRGLKSTTQAVLASPDAIDAAAKGSGVLTLRAHEPTFDTVTAAMLLVYRLQNGAWPESFFDIVHYVSEWEQGRTEHAGGYEQALAAVFYASMQVYRVDGVPVPREIVELMGEVMDQKLRTSQLRKLPDELISPRIARRLKADSDLYRTELSRGFQVQLDLPLHDGPKAPYRRIDALFLSSPQDVTVLKLIARHDLENSSYRRGYELMAVHAPNEQHAYGRHTITLAPESPGTLTDLAVCLERGEGNETPDGATRPRGKPRFSFQPEALGGLSDPWYSDSYSAQNLRSTIVAPPFAGTTQSREQIWEAIWARFNVGRNVHITSSRTLFARPYRVLNDAPEVADLIAQGWKRSALGRAGEGLLPSVVGSFLGDANGTDVDHLERTIEGRTLHLSLYPNDLVIVWVQQTCGVTTLFDLSRTQSELAHGPGLSQLPEIQALANWLEPVSSNWLVYGAYKINRSRSTMIDRSVAIAGLCHALAAGSPPTLAELPTEVEADARKLIRNGDLEHWFTATGGARLELELEDELTPPDFDQDFALFLLTTGQRYAAFEITRRMGVHERRARTSRWQSLRPSGDVRADVMFFTNSLWYSRVSDDPDLDALYNAWRDLHDLAETVESLRSQTSELDEYRKERFEGMVAVMVFVFLPITIVCGFFSGAQFNEMDLHVGLPWTTGGWKIFLIYTAFFTVVVFGALVAGRLLSWRKR